MGVDDDGGSELCDSNECNLNLNMFYFSLFGRYERQAGRERNAHTLGPFITFALCHCQRAQTLSS